jgi:alkylresorcinol/alkylpyrone synthase
MAGIVAVSAVLPEFVHPQSDITEALVAGLGADEKTATVIRRVHAATGVNTRHLVMPISEYTALDGFTHANRLFRELALPLVERAVREALDTASLEPQDIDFLFFTTVTGVGAPSLDAELIQAVGLRPDVRRIPSFGLGCVAGASALARVADLLKGHPGAVALVVSVEVCSLTVQWDDRSMANIVGTGLFGDGASAVVVVGADHPTPAFAKIVASRSALYPESLDAIGWTIGSFGFRLMLTAAVPELIASSLAADLDQLLADHQLERSDIDVWIAHPGGPRVLEAFSDSLGLEPADLAMSWDVMAEVGNLSSSAVLHVLERQDRHPAGHKGVLFAVGPGVSAELVLVEWT